MSDPIGLEVFRHRVMAVAETMGATLQRAACSPNIKERLDFSCAVFDGVGRLVAQAAHIPVHLGAMPAAVAAARHQTAPWQPGDVVILNDPYLGGSHLPDLTTVSPIFASGSMMPELFIATRAHHADVGGAVPGSLPNAADLFGEGLILPPVRLVRAGAINDDLIRIISTNSRTPTERQGDLEAQLAAHRLGTERLLELHQQYPGGLAVPIDALIAYSARMARSALREIPDGTYRFEDTLDDDGQGNGPLRLALKLTVADGRLTADFTGTVSQVTGGVNAPLAVTQSAVFYVVACLVGDVPINAGTFAPVEVIAPHGTLLNPYLPAAVAGGNVETSQRIVDVVLGALAEALPDRIPAASQGTMNNIVVGGHDPRSNHPFTYYETVGGGAGASPQGPGASGLQVHMTNTRNTPVEALEIAYPIRVDRYTLRRHSGGPGRHSGGDGIERALQLLAPATVSLLTDRRTRGPWGMAGGGAGRTGENRCVGMARSEEEPLPAKGIFRAMTGDQLIIRTPGGGGWGLPCSATSSTVPQGKR